MTQRIVIDTNVYISRFLNHNSTPGLAVARAWSAHITLISDETLAELRSVLNRKKLARYVNVAEVEPFLTLVREIAELIEIRSTLRLCRDPRDDLFLNLAIDGQADLLLTGDEDLLALDPFQPTSLRPAPSDSASALRILTPSAFLALAQERAR